MPEMESNADAAQQHGPNVRELISQWSCTREERQTPAKDGTHVWDGDFRSQTPLEFLGQHKDPSTAAWIQHPGGKKQNKELRKELAHVTFLRERYRQDEKIQTKTKDIRQATGEKLPSISNRWEERLGKHIRPETVMSQRQRREVDIRVERPNSVNHECSDGRHSNHSQRVLSRGLVSNYSKSEKRAEELQKDDFTKSRDNRDPLNRVTESKGGRFAIGTAQERHGSGDSTAKLAKQLLGSNSRPTTMRRIIVKRQGQVGLCFVWTAGSGTKQTTSHASAPSQEDEEEHKELAKKRRLMRVLRRTVQSQLVDTSTLPTRLWALFRGADADSSGRIERSEFARILAGVGLGEAQVGAAGIDTLFLQADRDGDGCIDFNEFLAAVVGNLVSL